MICDCVTVIALSLNLRGHSHKLLSKVKGKLKSGEGACPLSSLLTKVVVRAQAQVINHGVDAPLQD